MEALDLLLTRESALKLDAPAPSEADLDTMFQSAVRAPITVGCGPGASW